MYPGAVSGSISTPTARPVLTMLGAMIAQARILPPKKLQEALIPESIPAPKKAGVNSRIQP
jgi:hypothetical protein